MSRNDKIILKFREVLKETERLDANDLWLYQRSRITPLLLHARKNVPFYRDRLKPVFNGDEVDYSRWREIPILTREQANRERTRLYAKNVPPHMGVITADETSGTTGRPLSFLINDLVEVAALAMTDRLYRWWKFDGSKPMANFVSPRLELPDPEQTVTHGWCTGYIDGLNIMRKASGDIDDHIDWLSKTNPYYLGAQARMLRPLAERARALGVKIRVDKIVSRGSTLDREVWPLCRKVFRAELIDQYGANEAGQIACQCPHCKAYHINAEAVLVEILDGADEPVAPGQTGRVVLTSFYNYAMPFIRYEIGDNAQLYDEKSECAIKLPRLARIHGRYRNNFKLRDGRVIFPHPPMSGFREFFEYRQIQLVQTDYEDLEVRYVPVDKDASVDEAGFANWLNGELDAQFNVKLVMVNSITATPSGKFEDFLCLVE